MKRFLAILLAILMMLTVFASCNKDSIVEDATNEATDGETTLEDTGADAPADGTDTPADGTDAPAGETDKPADGTDAPAGETDKPADGTDKPADGTDKPADGTDTPSSGDTGNTTTTGTAPVLNGTKITFGSFPKTKVTDATLINTIKSKGNSDEVDGKIYKTVEHEGKKYLGVFENGDDTGVWFEFAPLTWTVLTQSNGEYLVICDEVIYAMNYDADSNDYESSDIRKWINGWFVKTAFAINQYSYIVKKTVDNSAVTGTGYPENKPHGNNTEDMVFLLSRPEINATVSGVTDRQKVATEYAYWVMGEPETYSAMSGAWWWTRTPYDNDGQIAAHRIKVDGTIWYEKVSQPTGGVVPAMWIKLQ